MQQIANCYAYRVFILFLTMKTVCTFVLCRIHWKIRVSFHEVTEVTNFSQHTSRVPGKKGMEEAQRGERTSLFLRLENAKKCRYGNNRKIFITLFYYSLMHFSKQNYTLLQKGCTNYSRLSTSYATDTFLRKIKTQEEH